MKSAIISLALVVITLAVIVPYSQGLDCYACVSGDGAKDTPGYHKKCKEGKLPDDRAKTCSIDNMLDPTTLKSFNSSQIEIMSKQAITFGCGKVTGKVGDKEASVKYCVPGESTKEDICSSGESGGVKGSVCICYSDKCNSAVTLNVKSATLFAAISAVFMRVGF